MRHLVSNEIADFASIYEDDVELISVNRTGQDSLEILAKQVFAGRKFSEQNWRQTTRDTDAPYRALKTSIESEHLPELCKEISLACEILGELLGCEGVGIRLANLTRPMCPRFHVDYVPCRLLMTIDGPATEWIASNDVDREKLADRSSDAPPLQNGGNIRQLTNGSLTLLKGGAWNDEFNGVVHRSPHDIGDRLLLSYDPLFERHADAN